MLACSSCRLPCSPYVFRMVYSFLPRILAVLRSSAHLPLLPRLWSPSFVMACVLVQASDRRDLLREVHGIHYPSWILASNLSSALFSECWSGTLLRALSLAVSSQPPPVLCSDVLRVASCAGFHVCSWRTCASVVSGSMPSYHDCISFF